MPYPPDLIVDNETVPVPLPAVTARLIVSSEIAGSVSFLFLPFPSFSFPFISSDSPSAYERSYRLSFSLPLLF